MKGKALVAAPHADDETLGCGGTIAKLVSDGWDVSVVVMTNAAQGAPELFSEAGIRQVRQEARVAHSILGVEKTIFLDLPAPCLDQYPQYKIANLMQETIRTVRPDTLFLPHRGDLHLDHGAVFNAGLVAARPFSSDFYVKTILAYETLSETEWGHPYPDSAFVPNYYVSLDERSFEKKLEAMQAFGSQLRDFPHPRSLDAIRSLAAFRGATVCRPLAEAFMLVRMVDS